MVYQSKVREPQSKTLHFSFSLEQFPNYNFGHSFHGSTLLYSLVKIKLDSQSHKFTTPDFQIPNQFKLF